MNCALVAEGFLCGLTKFIWTLYVTLLSFSSCSCSTSIEEKIDNYLKQCYQNKQFNGCVLVAKKGEIVYHKSYGIANFDPIEALQLDSQYRLASSGGNHATQSENRC